jgi:hypothetical protein
MIATTPSTADVWRRLHRQTLTVGTLLGAVVTLAALALLYTI